MSSRSRVGRALAVSALSFGVWLSSAGCSSTREGAPRSVERPPEATSARPAGAQDTGPSGATAEAVVHATYAGHYIYREGNFGILTSGPRVIKDLETFSSFQSGLPTHRIQKRQPAPPNDDPMLALEPDFEKHMLLVAYRVDVMTFDIHFEGVERVSDTLLVKVRRPSPDGAAHARIANIGGYAAILIDRFDGDIVWAPTQRE